MALAEANAAGGVDGDQVLLKTYDDQGQSDQARSVVTRLIDSDHVDAIIGEVASSNSLAAAPVCQRNGVPMITPASTNVTVTQLGNFIFRTCYIDPFQGAVMATFATKTLHLKKAAVFYDNSSDYSVGLKQFFIATFTKLGGTIVANSSYHAGDPDFRAQLATIKQHSPDFVYVPGYYNDVGTIARQAREQGLDVPLMGGDGWDSPTVFDSAGTALEGCYFSNHYSVQSKDPLIQNFVAAYRKRYGGAVPDAMAALAYDATHILLNAYRTVGKPADGDYDSPDYRAKLRDAIAATKNYPGVTGNITIGPDRNAVKPAVVLQIKGKAYRYVTRIDPDQIPTG
jgi:branched-chain amino acid transport system substrate-binding protein